MIHAFFSLCRNPCRNDLPDGAIGQRNPSAQPVSATFQRKRTATFHTTFAAAAELAREVEPEHATVDAISSRANASSRCFLSMFVFKDAAAFGDGRGRIQ